MNIDFNKDELIIINDAFDVCIFFMEYDRLNFSKSDVNILNNLYSIKGKVSIFLKEESKNGITS